VSSSSEIIDPDPSTLLNKCRLFDVVDLIVKISFSTRLLTLCLRVLHCEHEDNEHDNEISLDKENSRVENDILTIKSTTSNKRHLFNNVEGSGSIISDDEDTGSEMEYYEDNGHLGNDEEQEQATSSSCRSHMYDISTSKGKITIENLKECTLYTVDVSPVDASGHTIQPSEQFGSVHSTLCPVGVVATNNNDDYPTNFWFGDENIQEDAGQNGMYSNTTFLLIITSTIY
jgi:hypothetical protein